MLNNRLTHIGMFLIDLCLFLLFLLFYARQVIFLAINPFREFLSLLDVIEVTISIWTVCGFLSLIGIVLCSIGIFVKKNKNKNKLLSKTLLIFLMIFLFIDLIGFLVFF